MAAGRNRRRLNVHLERWFSIRFHSTWFSIWQFRAYDRLHLLLPKFSAPLTSSHFVDALSKGSSDLSFQTTVFKPDEFPCFDYPDGEEIPFTKLPTDPN
ncbi:hypothetical protein L1887_04969 [Cichorium endivia]|nr:hypothetical protein L1887_04969 [Cichorium endivia]